MVPRSQSVCDIDVIKSLKNGSGKKAAVVNGMR